MSWDELVTWSVEHGPMGLVFVSFLAATLLPLSSEIALGAAIAAGIQPAGAVAACSLGNCLACLFNYGIGRWSRDRAQQRLNKSRAGRLALQWSDRYGILALLGSWLPVVGDPLTLVAGVARVPLRWFIPLVFGLRIGRYLLIAGVL